MDERRIVVKKIIDGKSVLVRYFILTFLLILSSNNAMAIKVIYDKPNQDVTSLFSKNNAKYVIRYNHHFESKIVLPQCSEINFKGGSLTGCLDLNNTLLTGDVKLQGSKLTGRVRNDFLKSEWFCFKDGRHDDADNINQMIVVCGKIHFQKGNYLLKRIHKGPQQQNVLDDWQAEGHIGISKSGVELIGEETGVVFITPKPNVTICIYSPPYQFEKTIRNVRIENITFRALNDGKEILQLKHTIKAMGVDGLIIKKCNFDDFWGDAICLHSYGDVPSTGERTRNSNVVITDNHIKGGSHYKTRNGVAVVNGVNVRIERNIIEQTSGEGMPGAIDVEANSDAFSINNIIIKKNVIKNCRGTAGGICINSKGYNAPAYNIKIIENHISGCTSGLAFVVKTDEVTANYYIVDNIVASDTPPYQFIGNGKTSNWTFKRNVFKKHTTLKIPGKIRVKGLVSKGNIFSND